MFERKNHLSLAFHCLLADDEPLPTVNENLFITVSEMENLILDLRKQGYTFDLYSRVKDPNKKTCSITFDDGYFNNTLFVPLAEKYKIPFVIFVSAYNILNQSFYLWDMMEPGEEWSWKGGCYSKAYRSLSRPSPFYGNIRKYYRPLTKEELVELSRNEWVHFGNHTYSHTPFSRSYSENLQMELSACDALMAGFQRYLKGELALPCGLLSQVHKGKLLEKFDHIYTISGGLNSPGQKIVDRISLESPQTMGPMMDQIEKSCRLLIRTKRRAAVYWHSNF